TEHGGNARVVTGGASIIWDADHGSASVGFSRSIERAAAGRGSRRPWARRARGCAGYRPDADGWLVHNDVSAGVDGGSRKLLGGIEASARAGAGRAAAWDWLRTAQTFKPERRASTAIA